MFTRNKILFSILICMLTFTGCKHKVVKQWVHIYETACEKPYVLAGTKRIKKLLPRPEPTESKDFITVWVHGTIFPWQIKTVPHGLQHVDTLHERSRYRGCAEALTSRYPHTYQYENFYAFGWSGQLSFVERECAAKELHRELSALVAQHRKKGKEPKIRIICHSHGGNVALNLANIANPIDKTDPRLRVHELVLLACPVQCATSHCTKDPMFENIYVLYSRSDFGQIADPQGLYASMRRCVPHPVSGKKRHTPKCPLLSGREFIPQDNMLQGRLFLNGASAGHAEFSHCDVMGNIPILIDSLHECRRTADERGLSREEAIYSLHVKLKK